MTYNLEPLIKVFDETKTNFLLAKEKQVFDESIRSLPNSIENKKALQDIIYKFEKDSLVTILRIVNFSTEEVELRVVRYIDVFHKEIILKRKVLLARRRNTVIAIVSLNEEEMFIYNHAFKDEDYLVEMDHLFDNEYADTFLVEFTEKGIVNNNKKTTVYNFLKTVFSRFEESKIGVLLHDFYQELNKISKYKKEDFYNLDATRYIDNLFICLEELNSDPSFIKKLKTIKKYVNRSSRNKDIAIVLSTFIHYYTSLDNQSDDTLLDYTNVAISLYKIVEIIFYELLIERWSSFHYLNSNKEIVIKNIQDREKTTLGDLRMIFYSTDGDVKEFLSCTDYREINATIGNWISKDRNDHTHKDIMSIRKELDDSLLSTMNVLYRLIVLFD